MAGKDIRPAVVLVRDKKILVLKSRYPSSVPHGGEFYLLPGGGAEGMESLKEAAAREATEETGYDVDIKKLLYILEWIDAKKGANAVNVVFLGEIIGGEETHLNDPDFHKGNILAIEWKSVDELRQVVFHPKGILPWLEKGIENDFSGGAVYLEPDVTG